MSRIGKQPVSLPAKVEAKIDKQKVTVKGPKGELDFTIHPDMSVKAEDNQIIVERPTDQRNHRALHGMTRSILANMVMGVSDGFRISLVIEGVGYQAEMRDATTLSMKLGYSHEVLVHAPENVTFDVPKEQRGRLLHIDGIDKQVVGQVAANIRKLRPPEPYKGKGVRYSDEIIRRKAGKAAKGK